MLVYERAACKPARHEPASLSGPHVCTGNNRCLCREEKGWLGVPVFSLCPCLYYGRQQGWKITGVSRRLPFVPLTKTVLVWFSHFKAESSRCLFFPLRLFPPVWAGGAAEVLFCPNQTQQGHRSCSRLSQTAST